MSAPGRSDWRGKLARGWARLRRSTPRATTVVPQTYRVLSPVQAYSARDCRRADAWNRALYDRKIAALQAEKGTGVVFDEVPPPPDKSNQERRLEWKRFNMPVNADLQALAVQELARNDVLFRNACYEPQQAVSEYRRRHLRAPNPDAGLDALSESSSQSGASYVFYKDDELRNRTRRECRRADQRNMEQYVKMSRTARRTRARTASIAHSTTDLHAPPTENNVQRWADLKARSQMVSALLQTEAVEYLTLQGQQLYVDYEPQDAIYHAKRWRAQRGAATEVAEALPGVATAALVPTCPALAAGPAVVSLPPPPVSLPPPPGYADTDALRHGSHPASAPTAPHLLTRSPPSTAVKPAAHT